MGKLLAAGLALIALAGCAPGPAWIGPDWTPPGMAVPAPPAVFCYENPGLMPIGDPHAAWETVVDVVDDYFRIEHEEPVRVLGNVLTEGRLETFPEVGSTLLEPWRHDSADAYAKLESTLQTIRRRAVVRVLPAEGGYWVEVTVLKELEDMARPEHATAGASTFRYDGSLTRVVNPVAGQQTHEGWIPQGRDTALEQRILAQLRARSGIR